jgi:uncharacterized protein
MDNQHHHNRRITHHGPACREQSATRFPTTYGLAVNYTGARSRAVIAESLEVAPFSKLLFSSDACGPAELHYLGAVLWRRAMASVLSEWVSTGEWSSADAERVAHLVAAGNAKRVYQLAVS